jgi:hypothetical protein
VDRPIAWTRVTADTVVAVGPLLFYGLIMTTSAIACTVDVFDGSNTLGRRVMRAAHSYQDPATVDRASSLPCFLPAPILLERGLFLDLASNVTEVTVFYRPIREEQVTPLVEELVEGAPE